MQSAECRSVGVRSPYRVRSGTEVACCDWGQAFLFRTGPYSPGREGCYVTPRRAHCHEKSPHMIKLDADNGPGQLISWKAQDARRGAEASPPGEASNGRRRRRLPGGARRRTPVLACQGTHSRGPSFTGKLDSFRTRRKAVTGTGDRTRLRSSTARRLSTGRAAGQAPAQIRKKAWARSGAWPPRAQTERARSLGPFEEDHALRFLSNAKTQL